MKHILQVLSIWIAVGASSCSNNAGPNNPGSPGQTPPPGPGGSLSATQLSNDPFTDPSAQHKTAVEPSIAARGNQLVAAYQMGRISSGASDGIGFSTSNNGGATWTNGVVPGLTTFSGGTDDNVTDPVVTYDSAHSVWMIVSLIFSSAQSNSQVVVSRSSDGINWNAPSVVATGADYDKCWIACDNGAASPHRGTCYAEWDDVQNGQKILMSNSSDGGITWSSPQSSSDSITGIGGQIAILPSGEIVVPFYNSDSSNPKILSISSANAGQSWSASSLVSAVTSTTIPVRGETDPSVTVNSNGTIFVAWYDCRFETGCPYNDLVLTSSSDGTTWSAPTRIAVDGVSSGTNHFLPVIAANPGSPAIIGLLYYTSIASQCTNTSCAIAPQWSSSQNNGQSWTSPVALWQSFSTEEIANTTEGRMVGDYLSIAFSGSTAIPVFAAPTQPGSSTLNEEIFASPR